MLFRSKPVLTFGQAWYNTLPGAFRFIDNPSYDQVKNCRIDHDSLTQAVKNMTTHMGTGIVDAEYVEMVPGFNPKENAVAVSSAVQKMIA